MPPTANALRKRVVSSMNGAVGLPVGLGSVTRDVFAQFVQPFIFAGVETLQQTIQIQTDAHFLCMMSMYDTNLPASGGFGAGINQVNGGALVRLTDVSTGRVLQTGGFVPASTIFGTAQRPFVWPFTHIFRAGGGITIEATGVVASAQTVRFTFAGFKFPIGSYPAAGL